MVMSPRHRITRDTSYRRMCSKSKFNRNQIRGEFDSNQVGRLKLVSFMDVGFTAAISQ